MSVSFYAEVVDDKVGVMGSQVDISAQGHVGEGKDERAVEPRNVSTAEIRRGEIVAAARELYEERGLSHTSIKDIIDHIGVTRSLFYHYFSSKEEVTDAVLDNYIADYLEALQYWNEQRVEGNIDKALTDIVKVVRSGVREGDSFHRALTTCENAELYIKFTNRATDQITAYLISTAAKDYESCHKVNIDHVYESIYILVYGIIGCLRNHPDTENSALEDIIAQALHLERGVAIPGRKASS